ncbi:VOC family protein [Rhodococcus sp. NPDC058505]|uniref:VOC family protein n=1 Tax=unclassified Rhodococcus (in: high G+C Gram-positive bacteria) TaxID=192944 RepID=UPI0036652F84
MSEYSAPIGAPIWCDLMSSDPAGAADFYRAIFGWEVEGPPREEFGGYQNFTRDGRRVAGLSPWMQEAGGPPNVWSVYLHTADADATARAVEAAGGSVLFPPMAIGTEGTMLAASDTAGAAIGFWQPADHTGFSRWGEHGTPYWFESQSKDYAKSIAFYPKVIGARIEEVVPAGPDTPGAYSQVFVGESAYSGIMDAAQIQPAEVPSFWQVYITVDDVAGTVAQVESLGGAVRMPAVDTPYGTLAVVTDPFGAAICLGHPPAGM